MEATPVETEADCLTVKTVYLPREVDPVGVHFFLLPTGYCLVYDIECHLQSHHPSAQVG